MVRRIVDQAMPPSSSAASVAAPTDHPPASVKSLWRLRSYLRPHLVALAIMLGTALGGIALSIAIPLVTAALIDGPITNGGPRECCRWACSRWRWVSSRRC